jgi:hypothetical protein
MKIYDFTLFLSDITEMTEDVAEALVAAGCDDASPGSSQGAAFLVVHRQAESLEAAIRSAISDIQKAGHSVSKAVIEADAPVLQTASR